MTSASTEAAALEQRGGESSPPSLPMEIRLLLAIRLAEQSFGFSTVEPAYAAESAARAYAVPYPRLAGMLLSKLIAAGRARAVLAALRDGDDAAVGGSAEPRRDLNQGRRRRRPEPDAEEEEIE
jgi:hypothetical protein